MRRHDSLVYPNSTHSRSVTVVGDFTQVPGGPRDCELKLRHLYPGIIRRIGAMIRSTVCPAANIRLKNGRRILNRASVM